MAASGSMLVVLANNLGLHQDNIGKKFSRTGSAWVGAASCGFLGFPEHSLSACTKDQKKKSPRPVLAHTLLQARADPELSTFPVSPNETNEKLPCVVSKGEEGV